MVRKIEGRNGVGGLGGGNGHGDGSTVYAVRNVNCCGSVRMCGDFTGCSFDAHNFRSVRNPLQGIGRRPKAATDRKLVGCSRLHSQCPLLRQKIIIRCNLGENFHFGQRNCVFVGRSFCHFRCSYFYITCVCDRVKKKLTVFQCTLICNLIISASVCRYRKYESRQFPDFFGVAVLQPNPVHRVGTSQVYNDFKGIEIFVFIRYVIGVTFSVGQILIGTVLAAVGNDGTTESDIRRAD